MTESVTLIQLEAGGDTITVKSGGKINVETGGQITANGTQAADTTAALTTITIADAAGTPDYAMQAVINSSAYGFASAQELISFLYVVRNLQVRLAEVEAALAGAGITA